ncbi:hypothetical protein CC80DRAFT_487963 [Byssothecium circinans]|uniref:Uncharacterized protein n=1 Tax=Byssothecium circinans TaxID=147558 RepID=A0A6A5UCR8_9PLEO|nr:hypothetical protein CC80DRAFT_487963 [Byssothecium circinans]
MQFLTMSTMTLLVGAANMATAQPFAPVTAPKTLITRVALSSTPTTTTTTTMAAGTTLSTSTTPAIPSNTTTPAIPIPSLNIETGHTARSGWRILNQLLVRICNGSQRGYEQCMFDFKPFVRDAWLEWLQCDEERTEWVREPCFALKERALRRKYKGLGLMNGMDWKRGVEGGRGGKEGGMEGKGLFDEKTVMALEVMEMVLLSMGDEGAEDEMEFAG